jgi:hypothetical protein
MRYKAKVWRQRAIRFALYWALTVVAFAQCGVATPASQATIDTIDVNVDAKNAEKFLDFLYKHEDKILGLKVKLWSILDKSELHVKLDGENLTAYVTNGKIEMFCFSCAGYYQGAAVLDGYFLVKTEFHHGAFDVILRKLDEAQVLLSNPRKRPVQLK